MLSQHELEAQSGASVRHAPLRVPEGTRGRLIPVYYSGRYPESRTAGSIVKAGGQCVNPEGLPSTSTTCLITAQARKPCYGAVRNGLSPGLLQRLDGESNPALLLDREVS